MGFWDFIFVSAGDRETRAAASRLGIAVSEVQRQVPTFVRPNTFVKLVAAKCIRYSVPRTSAERFQWSFVQRSGTHFPNGYEYVGDAPPGDAFRAELRSVAEEFSEELFEFEGTERDVAVYWEEWGGQAMAERLRARLLRLADF